MTSFAQAAAAEVLSAFELESPEDDRPRRAIEAAREFVRGAPRSKLQRSTAPAAHRAAREATSETAFHAAMAAGDAAASAYLHPLADASQVGHILRSAAHAARVAELACPDNPRAGSDSLAVAARRASPALIRVLCRYPVTADGTNPVARLMHRLDVVLRGRTAPGADEEVR